MLFNPASFHHVSLFSHVSLSFSLSITASRHSVSSRIVTFIKVSVSYLDLDLFSLCPASPALCVLMPACWRGCPSFFVIKKNIHNTFFFKNGAKGQVNRAHSTTQLVLLLLRPCWWSKKKKKKLFFFSDLFLLLIYTL